VRRPLQPLRLLVADDYPLIRLAVREELDGRQGFAICAEAADREAAVEAARCERPDVCLLDVCMPGNGIHAAAEILADVPETRVVLMTIAASDEDMLAALSVGAAGYLVKDVDFGRLALILADVASGELAYPRRLMRRLVEERRGAPLLTA
jgi:two-component system, NarL family, nitrate/nitrite response regulator NarL